MSSIDAHRLIFIGGLHRSGTTALGRILADHDDVSGFANTGATEDEGQHLQTVYAPASKHGGPGRFALRQESHLTELSPTEAGTAATQLLDAWTPYWDLRQRFLVEKSPPNLIMGRYLQSVFPGSALVVIVRHPVVVALSTKKWTRFTTVTQLVEHWFRAHRTLREDAPGLRRLHVLRYEDLLARPGAELERLQDFLGLSTPLSAERIDTTRSDRYLEQWREMRSGGALSRRHREAIERRYTDAAREFGYLIDDELGTLTPWAF